MSTKPAQHIIGVDIGTTNTKAIAFTVEGTVIAQASITYMPLVTAAEEHELDVEILFNAVVQTIQQVTAQTGSSFLLGIAFSSAMHSLLAVDQAGKPLTNLITWADLRSSDQAARLKESDAGKLIYQRTGTPIHPMSPLCKLLWMKEQRPDIFAAAHKFIGIKELVFFRFFGQYLIDHSIASATGLFDIYDVDWNKEALLVTGLSADRLSTPVSPTHIVTGISAAYATMLGIGQDTPFIPGASDGCLANVGSGAMQPGDVSLTIGTSGAVRMMAHQPQHDVKERIFNYILTEQWYVSGGPINNGAVLLKWYAEHFLHRTFHHTEDFEWFLQQASEVPAGAEGLVFLPYVQGERAPVWDAAAKGVFFGIHARHTQAHFMRAIVEGINFALYQVTQSLEETIGPVTNIYASGGFTKSPHWLQWMADLFGKKIIVSSAADASATGAAILGLKAIGKIDDLHFRAKTTQPGEHFLPHEQQREAYLHNYRIYAMLYDRLKDVFHS
ncbi:gluconate kinase [Paraflavitalea soli]|uniref:Gluconate kinase n=1 Tax=Paraflavitalea soli TaxID=2315862 RepID=A0A3B7MXK2_9BACT|nr:gluconokinase [Paraflavitalea soli]AXY78848.1 gluconate kinase [Paraflavitalea soli]